jgi:Ulp1 protease family, C-terminal catalytic domain
VLHVDADARPQNNKGTIFALSAPQLAANLCYAPP